jgi:signal transduction histidine kinase
MKVSWVHLFGIWEKRKMAQFHNDSPSLLENFETQFPLENYTSAKSDFGLIALIQPLILSVGHLFFQANLSRSESISSDKQLYDISKKALELFIKQAPVNVAMFDREMRYLSASTKWLHNKIFINPSIEDYKNQSYYALSPYVNDEWKAIHEKCLLGSVEKSEQDEWVIDNERHWVRWEVQPWFESKGKIGGLILFCEDITSIKELENKAENLSKMNDDLESIAYMCPHDLQAHIRSLSGFLHLIKKHNNEKLDETTLTYLDYISKSVEGMKELISDSLLYANLGNTEIKTESVDLNALVKEAIISLTSLIEQRKAEIKIHPLPVVTANKGAIKHIFENLISNAIKFSNTSPLIEIGSQTDEENFIISVKDNGIGIPDKYFDQIFNKFQRLHSKDKYPGTGLGLSICKKIIEFHKGKIWVESTPEKGSTFYFNIPKLKQNVKKLKIQR